MNATDTDKGPAPIRILIAGGGPAGLVLAHALYESGLTSDQLEVVVLERRPAIVEPSGNCLALYPHTLRVLDQLGGGIADAVSRHGTRMTSSILCDRWGTVLHRTNVYAQAQGLLARPFVLLDRVTFLEILWDALVEKITAQETEDRPSITVLTGKRIFAVDQDDSCVRVVCADGSGYDGDVLIGADGVRSIVRRLSVTGQPPVASTSSGTADTPTTPSTTSTSTSASTSKHALDTNATGPFRTRYVVLFGMSPMPSRFVSADRTSCSVPSGAVIEAPTTGHTVQLLTYGPPGAPIFWAVYERAVAPGESGRRTYAPGSSLDEKAATEGASGGGVGGGARYSEMDVRAFAAREAARVAVRTAAPDGNSCSGEGMLTVAELFATSMPGRCGLTDLEEGVVPPGEQCVDNLLPAAEAAKVRQSEVGQESGWAWSRGRVVCVGDAVHKTTPIIGFGCNMAVEGVVVLVNHLRPLLLEAAAAKAGKGYVLTTSRLDTAFHAYAAARYSRARRWVELSGLYSSGAAWEMWWARIFHRWLFAWETWSAWLYQRWLLPKSLRPGLVARNLIAPLSRDAPILDWLDEPGFVEGPMAWTYRASGGGKVAATGSGQEKKRAGSNDGGVLGSLAWTWIGEPVQGLMNAIRARSA